MIYTDNELKKVEEKLESDKACELIDRLNDIIDDDNLPSIEDLIEAGIKAYKKKRMYISRTAFKFGNEIKDSGYSIEIEDNDGNGFSINSIYKEEDGMVSSKLVSKLNELAYVGYELKHSSDVKYINKED